MIAKRYLLVAFLLLIGMQLPPSMLAQPRERSCTQVMVFCWYGPYQDGSDEIDAWGTLWKSDNPAEKPIEQVLQIRCIRRLQICILARNQKVPAEASLSVTDIDLYNVRSWDENEIHAVMDENFSPDCEKDELVINRAEASVLNISSPGPSAKSKRCTDWVGSPKTVVYRLKYPEMENLLKKMEGTKPKK